MKNEKPPLKKDDNPSAAKYVGAVVGIGFVLLVVFLPIWPYALAWGYYPALVIGIVFGLAALFLIFGYAAKKQEPDNPRFKSRRKMRNEEGLNRG